ncbi:MAG: TlpA family protein disulfide reductase [Anaerolineae bacterium]|nr:TlpA family protein disulfide reductase [Anaerolineae bacterium]
MTTEIRKNVIGIAILVGSVVVYLVISRLQPLTQIYPPISTSLVTSAATFIRIVPTTPPTSAPFVTVTPRGWFPSPTPIGWTGFKEGQELADFALADLDGTSQKLTEYRDKRIILNFWASWCEPCRIEAPLLQSIYEQLGDKENIVVIGINLREDTIAINRFVDQFNWTFPVLLDTEGVVSESFDVLALPTTFFIDSEGLLRFRQFGLLSEEIIRSNLNAMPSTAMHSDSHSD